jgi:hypothetical protein
MSGTIASWTSVRRPTASGRHGEVIGPLSDDEVTSRHDASSEVRRHAQRAIETIT